MESKLREALNRAYAPYSKVRVAAILVTSQGEFVGVNIENAVYPATICAERAAIFQAISRYGTNQEFIELHVASSLEHHLYPCGMCLQVMSEFFSNKTRIHVHAPNLPTYKHKIGDLLPYRAVFDDVDKVVVRERRSPAPHLPSVAPLATIDASAHPAIEPSAIPPSKVIPTARPARARRAPRLSSSAINGVASTPVAAPIVVAPAPGESLPPRRRGRGIKKITGVQPGPTIHVATHSDAQVPGIVADLPVDGLADLPQVARAKPSNGRGRRNPS